MSTPFVIAVPAKGRLQENAHEFFARAGLALVKPRGARDYRGAISGLDDVEVAYLSASEITGQLAQGAVHLGITGEDLVREMIPQADRKVVLLDGLGFGFANVVAAQLFVLLARQRSRDVDREDRPQLHRLALQLDAMHRKARSCRGLRPRVPSRGPR